MSDLITRLEEAAEGSRQPQGQAMTDTVRVPREPTEAMLANGREALLPLVRLDSYGPLIGLWQDMLAASPPQPDALPGDLREKVAAVLYENIGAAAWSGDAEVHGIPEAADAILSLIQSERGGG
jgi:hypothetical protein